MNERYIVGHMSPDWDCIATPDAVAAELDRWFKHPAGFCALSGSDKEPRFDVPVVDVIEVAKAIDAALER